MPIVASILHLQAVGVPDPDFVQGFPALDDADRKHFVATIKRVLERLSSSDRRTMMRTWRRDAIGVVAMVANKMRWDTVAYPEVGFQTFEIIVHAIDEHVKSRWWPARLLGI